MRYLLIALSLFLCPAVSTYAQISISIGINVPVYPRLVRVPGYPVYYAPQANWNFFFYDGLYWVYLDDDWYASSWYNGPWQLMEPEYVPLFILRVPVRYYRHPPVYFRGWRSDAPPRWGEHWGRDWEDRRRGWDRWNHRSVAPAAPLPLYQRQYSGNRYPRSVEQQRSIQSQHYHYQPREAVTRQQFQQRGNPRIERPSDQQQHVQPYQQRQQQINPRAEPYQQRPSDQQQRLQPYQQRQPQINPRAEPHQQRPSDQQQRLQPDQQRQQQMNPHAEPHQQRPSDQQQHLQPNQQQRQQHPPQTPHDKGRKNKYEESGQENQ